MRCYNCENSDFNKNFECLRMSICSEEDRLKYEKYKSFNIHEGSKIRFKGEKRFYTVKACDNRFVIAYRNWKDTYYYTICDLKECIRGADNYGGYYNYRDCTKGELEEALFRLNFTDITESKELDESRSDYIEKHILPLEISYKNWAHLDIEEVK